MAAVTIKGDVVNHICVFYQTPGADGAVKMVSFAGRHRSWHTGDANLRDPPLYGTSLTAVPPRPGYLGRSGSDPANKGQPIYYLQMDNNAVGSGQGTSGMHLYRSQFCFVSYLPYHRTSPIVGL